MNEGHAYPSPQAFRQALTDKLRDASQDSIWTAIATPASDGL